MPMPSLLGLKRVQAGSPVVRSGIKDKDVNTPGPEPTVSVKETEVPSPPRYVLPRCYVFSITQISFYSRPSTDVENNIRPQPRSVQCILGVRDHTQLAAFQLQSFAEVTDDY